MPSKEEQIQEWKEKRSREDFVNKRALEHTIEMTGEMLEELLIDGFNVENRAVAEAIAEEAIRYGTDEGFDYGGLAFNLYDGDYLCFATGALTKTAKGLAKQINKKALKPIEGTAAASRAAGALYEGDNRGVDDHVYDFVEGKSSVIKAMEDKSHGSI